ncbi:MAG: hypothetical protein IT431_01950, partial [Phycisphaerales bacterium]|nr:hypothetical protein [Phycisphaerales bacterium]
MRRTGDDIAGAGRRAGGEGPGRLRLVGDVAETPRGASRGDDSSARSDRGGERVGTERVGTERMGTEGVRADRSAHRAWEVSAENQAASALSTFDARWVLAVRASEAVEGGRAAVIRPEARQRLVSTARTMGLRPFDANLVLAIVQDAAREGRTARDLETIDSLML